MEKTQGDKAAPPAGRKASPAASAVAALFGVQSDRNRRQDFSQQSPWPFIIAGIAGIAVFVGVLVTISLVVTAPR